MTLLISVLVLGAVTLVVGASMAIRGIEEVDIGNSGVQTIESLTVTEACIEEALLQIKRFGSSYTGTSLNVGDGNCVIGTSGTAEYIVLQSTGAVKKWTRKVVVDVVLTGSNIATNTWRHNNPDNETIPPIILSMSPEDEESGVALDSNLIITFSEMVSAIASVNNDIELRRLSDHTLFETIDIQSPQVTGDATPIITINPSSNFDESTSYYVNIGALALQDASENRFSGINDSTTWNFSTFGSADLIPPTIHTLSPADNSTNVLTITNFLITFNEAVLPKPGVLNDILIKRSSDNVLIESIDAESAKVTGGGTTTIFINPSATLDYDTSYYVQIQEDAIDDLAGNSFAGISNVTTWNFTTVPYSCTPSEIVEISCSDGADNDCNGDIDCEDENCGACGSSSSSCSSIETICDDGVDNDCDGYIDCDDDDCWGDVACTGLVQLVTSCNSPTTLDFNSLAIPPNQTPGDQFLASGIKFTGASPEVVLSEYRVGHDTPSQVQVDMSTNEWLDVKFTVPGTSTLRGVNCFVTNINSPDTFNFIEFYDSTDTLIRKYYFQQSDADNYDCGGFYGLWKLGGTYSGGANNIWRVRIGTDSTHMETFNYEYSLSGGVYFKTDCGGTSSSMSSCSPTETICDDGIDNDCDYEIDCSDEDCEYDPYCEDSSSSCSPNENPETTCDDGVDNDCDGDEDCSDLDCEYDPYCGE
ncbi:MAG: Ig-like domain-containing protein [Candidatus Peribacteraceae bacterium]|nr:Ig-like domain-containing protein [Candidatus Peribacteraceae bacterium]